MKITLEENERIDDLELQNLKIIQNNNGFCYGIDSILLSDFAKEIKQGSKIVDLGTGTAILPILLSAKTKNTTIVGIEIQKQVAKMANKSIMLNNLQDRIQIICDNVKNVKNMLNAKTFDAVITNPPYKKKNTGMINETQTKIIARHEVEANLEEFIQAASYLLKDQGNMYMVHRPERLVDICSLLRQYKIEPKVLKFIQADITKAPNLLLIKGVKNAKPFLKMEKTLMIYQENGQYTNEILKIYHKI